MPNYTDTTDDYRIRYTGCYARTDILPDKYSGVIKLTEEWKRNSNGVVASGNVVTFRRDAKNKTVLDQKWVDVDDLNLKPLPMGAINLAKSVVVMVSKKPHNNAKYRRLPCDGNTDLIDPFQAEREYLELRPVVTMNDFFILSAWAKNEYLPAVEALDIVSDHKRLGAAFDPQYFFGISLAGDGIYLYKGHKRVARVNTEKEILLKPEVHWLAEQLAEFGLTVKRIDK